jgi:hypothetical protein
MHLMAACWLIVLNCVVVAARGDDPKHHEDEIAEIAARYGAQAKALAEVERLGGQVEFEGAGASKTVVRMDLSRSRATDSDLSLLKSFPELREVRIGDSSITEAGIRTRLLGREFTILRMPSTAPPYFPRGAFRPDDPDADDYQKQSTSEQLHAMKEPSLWERSRTDRRSAAYRLIWLRSSDRPVVVRLERTADSVRIHQVQLDRYVGTEPGKVALRKSSALPPGAWDAVRRRIEGVGFWTLPADVEENRGIADGDALYVEGIEGGRYHLIFRAGSTARADVLALAREMIEHSGADLLDQWDKYREANALQDR